MWSILKGLVINYEFRCVLILIVKKISLRFFSLADFADKANFLKKI